MYRKLRLSDEEIEWYKPLIKLYLTYGSVDKVFVKQQYDTGVSYPHFHRILKEWGVIKSTGPKSRFTEAVYFFGKLVKEELPLETLYRSMPSSLQVSAVTLHRILSYVKRGLVRRYATALIISPESNLDLALVGKEITTARPELGKPIGSLSIPMTYAKRDEPSSDSVLRVLQQEVASTMTVNRKLPLALVPNNPKVVLTIDIADVRVRVFCIVVPDKIVSEFDSFKLADLSFMPLSRIAMDTDPEFHFRAGVPEICAEFLEINRTMDKNPRHLCSLLNKQLALLPAYA